jgi:hypothetical protein
LRFAPETGDPLGNVRNLGQQDLQRHVTIELDIARAIHRAHTAFAKDRADFV